jgi:hypothetical protein
LTSIGLAERGTIYSASRQFGLTNTSSKSVMPEGEDSFIRWATWSFSRASKLHDKEWENVSDFECAPLSHYSEEQLVPNRRFAS